MQARIHTHTHTHTHTQNKTFGQNLICHDFSYTSQLIYPGDNLKFAIIIHTYTYGRCPWCNGYRRRKWTRWYEFKSWPRLIAFHIALIPLGKDRLFFSLGEATSLREGKLWIQTFKLRLKIDLVSYPTRAEGLVNMNTHTHTNDHTQ